MLFIGKSACGHLFKKPFIVRAESSNSIARAAEGRVIKLEKNRDV
jgi:hypothetical protein